MPRFVLLRHECPPNVGASHWDFMLERDGELLTWRLPELPADWCKMVRTLGGVWDAEERVHPSGVWGASSASQTPLARAPTSLISATRLANHRLAYLDDEGPLSNNRGEVRRVDAGDYALLDESSALLRLLLNGALCRGHVALTHINGDAWRLETYCSPANP